MQEDRSELYPIRLKALELIKAFFVERQNKKYFKFRDFKYFLQKSDTKVHLPTVKYHFNVFCSFFMERYNKSTFLLPDKFKKKKNLNKAIKFYLTAEIYHKNRAETKIDAKIF